MKKLWIVILAAALAASSCSDRYEENDLELLTSYRAKELCSCLFVMEQTEDYCVAFTVASPNLASFRIDREEKSVETSALLDWGASAHYVDARRGCVID